MNELPDTRFLKKCCFGSCFYIAFCTCPFLLLPHTRASAITSFKVLPLESPLYAAADYFPKIAFCCCSSAQTFTASPVQFLMCKQVVLQKLSYKLSVQNSEQSLRSVLHTESYLRPGSLYLYPHIKSLSTATYLPKHSSNHYSLNKGKIVFLQEMYSELHFWDVRHISWPTGNSPSKTRLMLLTDCDSGCLNTPVIQSSFNSSSIRKSFMMKSLSPHSSWEW